MVSDVRMKIRMRLVEAIKAAEARWLDDPVGREVVKRARENRVTAEVLRETVRTEIGRGFPGCTIQFSYNRIYLRLPNRYPDHMVPISEAYPRRLRAVLYPIATETATPPPVSQWNGECAGAD